MKKSDLIAVEVGYTGYYDVFDSTQSSQDKRLVDSGSYDNEQEAIDNVWEVYQESRVESLAHDRDMKEGRARQIACEQKWAERFDNDTQDGY